MSNFDDLIRAGRDTDAVRLFARTYYDNGKIGHTRMMLLVRVADNLEKAESQLARYKRALELACQFSIDPEQSMKIWLEQTEKEGKE